MKRRIKTERIIILLLSVIVILQSVFLIIVLCTSKKESICTSEKKNDLANMNEVVCGDDSDIARFMCVRYRESGYVITFKEKVDDMHKYKALEIKLFGVKRPFNVTKVGDDYVLYNCLNTFTAAKNAGLKEVPCRVISNKMMNLKIKDLNFHRRDHKLKEI